MLITLLKKQIAQTFSFLTMDTKKGKVRTTGRVALIGLAFVFCFVAIGVMFFHLSDMLLSSFHAMNLDWLYFIFVGIMSISLCVIGSVFSTYSSLYRAKDNDMLLSLPVRSWMIIVSRVISVYLMGLLFTLPVWGAAIAQYAIQTGLNAKTLFCQIVLFFMIGLVSLSFTCFLGWIVALIASRMKHRNFAVTAISLIAFALYYYFIGNSEKLIGSLIQNAGTTAESIERGAAWLRCFSLAALGSLKATALCSLVSIAIAGLCCLILVRTFTGIATMKTENAGKVYVEKKTARKGLKAALLGREFKRLANLPAYMLNCALGTVFIPALMIYAAIKAKDLTPLIELAGREIPEIAALMPLILMGVLAMLSVFNDLTAPSVSLEAKTLWIVKTLPIRSIDLLNAKQLMHIILTAPVTVLASAVLSAVLRIRIPDIVLVLLFSMIYVCFSSAFGLTLNLKMPNLNWQTETAAVKSGAAVTLALFGQWAILIAVGFGCYYACEVLPVRTVMILTIVFFAALTVVLNRWIRKKGVVLLENLIA